MSLPSWNRSNGQGIVMGVLVNRPSSIASLHPRECHVVSFRDFGSGIVVRHSEVIYDFNSSNNRRSGSGP
jgi:hypothetical protein